MSRACRKLSALQSPYLDGALSDGDRERLLAHLVRCAPCRAELEDLRAVRQLLHSVGTAPVDPAEHPDRSDPAELAARLVSIAGADARVPVWSRPFRRTGRGSLPSARQATRARVVAGTLAFLGLASAVGGVGYVLAPPGAAVLPDPSVRARSDFAATLGQLPLSSRSLSALMMSPGQGAAPAAGGAATLGSAVAGRPVSRAVAVAALQRAGEAGAQVAYTGTQAVTAVAGRPVSARVRVTSDAGRGTTVAVLDRSGRPGSGGFVPAVTSSRLVSSQLLTLLQHQYDVTGWSGARIGGRAATVVQASTSSGGRVRAAARWWVDDATGLLLRQETYDRSGALSSAAGFTTLHVSAQPGFLTHLEPRLAISTTRASLTLSNAGLLARQGWSCGQELAGLTLVRLRSDAVSDPGTLHMVYSDGVSTLSVFEQRGRLTGPPDGATWDEPTRAWVQPGPPSMATWRSGGSVFTVVTDASPSLVRAAVAALPHEKSSDPTTMERVRAGWHRVLQVVVGR